jgi:hypothetical protein
MPTYQRGSSGSVFSTPNVTDVGLKSMRICIDSQLGTGLDQFVVYVEERGTTAIQGCELILQSKIRGLKSRLLFVKLFLWFWVTVLVLFAISVGSRMIGTRVVPSTEVIAAFAPRVADEAAQAYESGGPKEFANFDQSLKGTSGRALYLIDGSDGL